MGLQLGWQMKYSEENVGRPKQTEVRTKNQSQEAPTPVEQGLPLIQPFLPLPADILPTMCVPPPTTNSLHHPISNSYPLTILLHTYSLVTLKHFIVAFQSGRMNGGENEIEDKRRNETGPMKLENKICLALLLEWREKMDGT